MKNTTIRSILEHHALTQTTHLEESPHYSENARRALCLAALELEIPTTALPELVKRTKMPWMANARQFIFASTCYEYNVRMCRERPEKRVYKRLHLFATRRDDLKPSFGTNRSSDKPRHYCWNTIEGEIYHYAFLPFDQEDSAREVVLDILSDILPA